MNGPHFDYLTNSYVEALGLEPFPVQRQDPVAVWLLDTAVKPLVMRAFDFAVVYNHALYFREYDGLAWSRMP